MRTVWRLTKAKYAEDALSGRGSLLRGGRWHARGRPAVYCATSPALALLETLVHVERLDLLRFEYVVVPITLRAKDVERLEGEELPADWKAWPHPASTRSIGTQWLEEQRTVALDVPSVVVPLERNIILNPLHPNFGSLDVGPPQPFPIDERLTGR